MKKYICGTSLSHLILVTVCEKAAQHKVFTASPDEGPRTEPNVTFSWHKTWFISYYREISFLVAPPYSGLRCRTLREMRQTAARSEAYLLSQTVRISFLSSASEHISFNECTFFCMMSLTEVRCVFVFGSWAGFIAVWVENKYFLSSSGLPKDREPSSVSFSLALAFPSSWSCDWVHGSEVKWGGRPAATPRSLPFLHKHKNPSKGSAQRGDRCRILLNFFRATLLNVDLITVILSPYLLKTSDFLHTSKLCGVDSDKFIKIDFWAFFWIPFSRFYEFGSSFQISKIGIQKILKSQIR